MGNTKIKSIKTISKPKDRYDITVAGEHCYYANNILVHNTDGMNIMISWKNGKLIFARNGSHLKKYGERALDINSIKSMFAGRGSVSDAFSTAADDLQKAIGSLSEKQRSEIFNEGHNFMSLEVIFVENLNTIPYDSNMLIFHGSFEYDSNGKPIGQSSEAGGKLSSMISNINQHIQTTYNISGPPVINLPKSQDFSKLQSKYLTRLSRLQSKFRLKDSDMVSLYHQKWWESFIDTEASKRKFVLSNDIKVGLVNRWAFGDKSYRLTSSLIKDTNVLDWVNSYNKNNYEAQFKSNILPFELLFLELGADVLNNFKSILIIDQDKAMVTLKKELASAARELRKTTDITKLSKFKAALEKLRAIGGMETIVPTEGIVFQYPSGPKGKIYKLTGSFANVHRILSMLKY